MRHRVLVIALLFLLAIISAATSRAAAPAHRHVVVLEDDVRDSAAVTREHVKEHAEGSVLAYTHALKGYAADIPEREVEDLRRDPRVALVEPDRTLLMAGQTIPWGIKRVGAQLSSTRAGDGRGRLRRIRGYVLDTGIDPRQRDLNLRQSIDFTGGGPAGDCRGHGTHVAGTFAARDNARSVVSAAPGMALTSVKVLNCHGRGTTSQVIRGIDWITAHARKPAVANMSLSGSASDALDHAVRRSAKSGVFYAVAAGNQGVAACERSPARAGAGTNGIVTVAATDGRDRAAGISNYGPCVDVWAPGVRILSTRRGGGMGYMSGTSMASPHVAGGAALTLSRARAWSPARVESALKRSARVAKRRSRDGRVVRRLFVGGF